MKKGTMEYIRPILNVITVETEKGFAGSGSGFDDNNGIGGSAPEYDYKDETWD